LGINYSANESTEDTILKFYSFELQIKRISSVPC